MSVNMICINATLAGEKRVAHVINHRLEYLDIEDGSQYRQKSNIYAAEVTSVEASLDAVFVKYGGSRHGFLPYKEIASSYIKGMDNEESEKPALQDAIQVGQKLMVQVEKEERGTKGAALTTYISLAGAYLVLMPNNPGSGGVSKRVDANDRDQTKELLAKLEVPKGMGLIVRTAGVGRTLDELTWDLESLLHHWQEIQKAFAKAKPKTLIHQEGDIFIRAIRDQLRPEIEQILVDDEKTFHELNRYMQRARPHYVERLKWYDTSSKPPLFTHLQIEEQIDSLFSRTIALPCGGSIVIDNTEALTAIDVNSASATKGANIEDTAFQINLEAAEEAARQIRLRDIGGIIIIDFIDMNSKESRQAIYERMGQALNQDRARTQHKEISDLSGVMEISRQRLSPPLSEQMFIPCPHCQGLGYVRNDVNFGNHVLRRIEEACVRTTCDLIQVQLPVEIANYLLNIRGQDILRLQSSNQMSICILGNPNITTQRYYLKRIRLNDKQSRAEFVQVDERSIDESTPQWQQDSMMSQTPMVSQTVNQSHPTEEKTASESMFKRLWGALFSSPAKEENKPTKGRNANRRRRQSSGNRNNTNNTQGSNRTSSNPSRTRHPRRNGRGGNRQNRRSNATNKEET